MALSPDDYVRFAQLHLCALTGQPSELLDEGQAQMMHKPHLSSGSGMGWGVTEINDKKVSFHIGGTGDFTSFIALVPDDGVGFVALMNVGGPPSASAQEWLMRRLNEL